MTGRNTDTMNTVDREFVFTHLLDAPRGLGGETWQIVPTALGEMLQDKDAEKSERVMKALLHMKKIDIKSLEQAYTQR